MTEETHTRRLEHLSNEELAASIEAVKEWQLTAGKIPLDDPRRVSAAEELRQAGILGDLLEELKARQGQ